MSRQVEGYLSREELDTYRDLEAKTNLAINLSGHAYYTRAEAEQSFKDMWQFIADMCEKYELDHKEVWDFSLYDGAFWITDEPER